MTASLVTLRPEEAETVLRAALREVYGVDAWLDSWSAERFTTHGRHPVMRYDLRVHVAGASDVQHHQWVGKFYNRGEDARRAETILRALAGADSLASGVVITPRVVACDPARALLLMTYEDGSGLSSAIRQHDGVALSAVARALAALHATEDIVDDATSPAAVLDELRPRVADLRDRFPDQAASLQRRLVTLERETPRSPPLPSFLHGDFGPAQLLWRMGRIVVLDFDKCTRGDPALDLGNLLTQLRRITLRKPEKLPVAFASLRTGILDAYRRWTSPDPGLDRRVAWYEQTTLLRKIHGLAFDRTRHPEPEKILQRQAEAIRLLTLGSDSV